LLREFDNARQVHESSVRHLPADVFQITVPDAQPGENFRLRHIEIGAEDTGFGMKQEIERSAGRGYDICCMFQEALN
jgi:hypothetical protein